MEQSIGKRIAENRKRLGMTQDQLAEQVGVTAQAVSKWENDQSCPDITILPKLADLFGISIDELLGRSDPHIVHHAEAVEDTPSDTGDVRLEKGGWEFTWDAGRRNAIVFAVFVLMVGCLTLADALLDWDVSFWSILWPSALLMLGVRELLTRFTFFSMGCTLLGGYFLLENLDILHLNLGFKLVLPIVLLLFGLSLLADALRKKNKKPTVHIHHHGGGKSSRSKEESFSMNDETFCCETSFGSNRHLIQLPRLQHGSAECNFGELVIDLSGVQSLAPGCSVDASCSFGELTLLVPEHYQIQACQDTSFASFSVVGQPVNPRDSICLNASVSFGEIKVKYI